VPYLSASEVVFHEEELYQVYVARPTFIFTSLAEVITGDVKNSLPKLLRRLLRPYRVVTFK